LVATGALLAAPLARAQQPGRTYRVAYVATTSPLSEMAGPDPEHPLVRGILRELRSLGYVEGRNLVYERRSAEGDPKRYKGIIDEVVQLKPDVMILAGSRALLRTAQSATRTVPIVQTGYPRLVEDGFAVSLARPGGNITGPAGLDWAEQLTKLLQLFKETVSRLSRVAVVTLWWEMPDFRRFRDALHDAAAAMRIELVPVAFHLADPRATFAAIAKVRVDGILIPGGPQTYGQREDLGRLALAAGLPAASEVARTTEAGGLISYQSDPIEHWRTIVRYVDKILKGARPGDLPAEAPTKFELVINMKTAKALGIAIPQSILLRADRVIE
jgi:putative ABC transport system substrate-binding protein